MTPKTSLGNARAEKEFGFVVGSVLLALGGWWLFRGKFPIPARAFLGIGGLLVLLGAVAPSALRLPFRLWMKLAEGLSWIMTRLILSIVFFLIVSPIGFLRRLLGHDPLRRRSRPTVSSWSDYTVRQRDTKHYEKTF